MTLSTREKASLRALPGRSDLRGFLQLGWHLLLLAGTSYLVLLSEGKAWLLPAVVAQGIVLVFLFCALHETVHRTAFRSRWINDVVASLCGLVICLPPSYFRAYHFAHHKHTQDPKLDPELASPRPAKFSEYLWYLSGLPYWIERLTKTREQAFGRIDAPFVPDKLKPRIQLEARAFLAVYAAIALASLATLNGSAILYWLLPMLLGQPFLRAFLLAEHHDLPRSRDMMMASRTTQTNPLVAVLSWNMPYHGAHHSLPALPFHALPAADRLLAMRPRSETSGYLAFHLHALREFLQGRTWWPRF